MTELKLDELWKIQQEFANRMANHFVGKDIENFSYEERVAETRDYILSLVGETQEVLQALPWKRHRHYDENSTWSRYTLLEELIDLQKYLWGLMAIWEVTPEEFSTVFRDKSAVVEHRWLQDKGERRLQLNEAKSIAVVDIDGVLNTYPHCFIDWAKNRGIDIDLETNSRDRIEWEKAKSFYRMSGGKRAIPAKKGAKELTQTLHELGFFVAITTNRPVERYPNIVADTLSWLNTNGIYYDYINWSDLKTKVVDLSSYLDQIKLVLDDDDDILTEFDMYEVPIFPVRPLEDLEPVISDIKELFNDSL